MGGQAQNSYLCISVLDANFVNLNGFRGQLMATK